MTDRELLDRFRTSRCENSFRQLVKRYGGLVYQCAMRRTGDSCLAEEIAQNVFRALAAKSDGITVKGSLASWLHRAAVLESAAAYRAEGRRRSRMSQLADHERTTMTGKELQLPEEDRENWEQAVPLLDEAIEQLSARDRLVVLMRFFERKSFREIAATVGTTDDACRKRVSRALEKLGRILRRRGVALPSAALLACLSTQLSDAAPAELESALCSSSLEGIGHAIATVPSVATAKVYSFAATALALWLACIGGGFWIGHTSAASSSPEGASSRDGAQGQNAASSKVAGRSRSGAIARAGRPLSRAELRQILEMARDEFSLGMWDSDAYWRATLRLRQIPPGSLETALQLIEEMPGGVQSEVGLAIAILRRLAESDGPAACQYAEDQFAFEARRTAITAALEGWAKANPAAAFDWYEENVDLPRHQAKALVGILQEWTKVDPAGALETFRGLGDPKDQMLAFSGLLDGVADAGYRRNLLTLIRSLPSDSNRAEMVAQFVTRWAYHDAPATANWLGTVELSDYERERASHNLLFSWMNSDAKAAANWTIANAAEGKRKDAYSQVISSWVYRDSVALGEWLTTQPRSPETDPGRAHYVQQVAISDPERAASWALTISSDSLRQESLRTVLGVWRQRDPKALPDGIRALDLPPAKTEALLEEFTLQP